MKLRRPGWAALVVMAVVLLVALSWAGDRAAADSYTTISGEGSSWSANALDQWAGDVQQYGMQVNYTPNGSTTGRQDWLKGLTDFAASDIPFQSDPQDGSAPEDPSPGSYAYMPITSGGTAFMYNLLINGQRVTNLRLSGQNLARIFTGQVSYWDDPGLQSYNPGLTLPHQPIVPVVRSDGSGSTFTLSQWMISQFRSAWTTLCTRSGRPSDECGPSSFYPTVPGMVAQSGDAGVSAYVAASYANGAIGYVNYSYALQKGFPVVKMLNAAGYYTAPTPTNVAVSLLAAQVDTTDVNDPSLYLTQQLGGVYTDPDPRTYPLSMYSYLILPTRTSASFTTAKGRTLAAFAYYAMCQGQQESMSPTLGYSPLPINLVQDAFNQIRKIPGAVVENINIPGCNNPTFSPDGSNRLAEGAPMPPACDKAGTVQCATATGGATKPTPVSSSGGTATSPGANGHPAPATGASPVAEGSTAPAGGAVVGVGPVDPASGSSASGEPAAGGTGTPGANSAACAGNPCPTAAGVTVAGLPAPAAVSAAVPRRHGWGSAQNSMLLVAVFALALVLAPGIAARLLGREPR